MRLSAAAAGVPGSFVGVPELECVVDELAVLAHGTDHGMIAHKWQQLLLGRLTLDERSDGPEVKGAVAEGKFAGLFNCRSAVAARKAQETLEHSDALDAAGFDHGLGPSGAMRAQSIRDSAQEPRCAALDSGDLLCRDVLVRRAEAARLLPGVHRNLAAFAR